MKNRSGKYLILMILLGLSYRPLFAQEDILKTLVEDRNEHKYAFYPSTLRMINLTKNQEYNELVKDIDKLLIYMLDSGIRADKGYRKIAEDYASAGYEEYAMAYGGDLSLAILGSEQSSTNTFVGYLMQDELAVAFYLRGAIAWQKIPTLLNTMRKEDLFNFLDPTSDEH
ncbi:MAG: hypothetical protein RIC30_18680 [Marinoscillum sp.]|uniref:hypothetical protein n=1 Tax=Marinoscillum sp. TaxID=2024838 RepID=UPI0033001787